MMRDGQGIYVLMLTAEIGKCAILGGHRLQEERVKLSHSFALLRRIVNSDTHNTNWYFIALLFRE